MTFDLDVILAAHGGGDSSRANAAVRSCAQRLGTAAVGARVTAAFILGEPSYETALQNADRPNRLIIPLLTSDGHFAARLRTAVEQSRSRRIAPIVADPVGTDAALRHAIADQVAVAIKQGGLVASQVIVLVVGHGTRLHSASGNATRALARAIARQSMVATRVAYLSQSPTIEDAVSGIRRDAHFIVIPFFFGGGDHADVDTPSQVESAMARCGLAQSRVTWVQSMGGFAVLDVIVERVVRDARPARVLLNVGARASQLSRCQVDAFAARVASRGVDVRFVPITTRGDRDQATPIHAMSGDDPFTHSLSDALRCGTIDVAVHSMKDLPLGDDPRIVDAAILLRGAVDEVLVSRTGAGLMALHAGARIGTSSERRASQLRRVRPDLVPVPIRGDVLTRIAAVDDGTVDAVVLAAAGLERLSLIHRITEWLSVDSFLPAPAQGALVVQCRDDSPHRALLQSLDDADTRLAVAAELAFARAVSASRDRVAAAHAIVASGGITLRACIIDPNTDRAWHATVTGRDPEVVGTAAAAAARALGAHAAAGEYRP